MIAGVSPVLQALLGTLFTWGLTAAGAALVFVFSSGQVRRGLCNLHIEMWRSPKEMVLEKMFDMQFPFLLDKIENGEVYQRRRGLSSGHTEEHDEGPKAQEVSAQTGSSWRRVVLLILAITIHNIPGDVKTDLCVCSPLGTDLAIMSVSFRNLAIGIGIQNFPEGLAVSLPLRGSGVSTWRSFWYGQLSGMVEPLAGLLGAVAVVLAEPLLPYALAFAAGAMVYVVVDDIIPEAQVSGNGKLASWTSILGFIVMMSLDVGLG
uniref:Zinc transporter ZIP11 n=1 Tax=Sinocyclocheilus grahami TaxID=75366 RepID=A0A672KRW1_SINGR